MAFGYSLEALLKNTFVWAFLLRGKKYSPRSFIRSSVPQNILNFIKTFNFSVTQNKIFNSLQTFKCPCSVTCGLLGFNKSFAD